MACTTSPKGIGISQPPNWNPGRVRKASRKVDEAKDDEMVLPKLINRTSLCAVHTADGMHRIFLLRNCSPF